MSSQSLSSPLQSVNSSIPAGAEATEYNNSHHQRPASSRKLFVNRNDENLHHSESSHPVAGLNRPGGRWEESEWTTRQEAKKKSTASTEIRNPDVSTLVESLPVADSEYEGSELTIQEKAKKQSTVPHAAMVPSDVLVNHVDTMFAKLSEDLDRAAKIYGDGSFFTRSFETYDAEVEELGKLNGSEARAQLQRYALRCHVSEREKEQLYRRNRELSDALEILRTFVLRTQSNIFEKVRRVAKQATDGLNELQQSSSNEIKMINQKHALSVAQSNTLQNQLKQTTKQLEEKKEELKEANKNLDMLRFERDALRNQNDQRDSELEKIESRMHDLEAELKSKENALIDAKAKIAARDREVRDLEDKLKTAENAADARLKKREAEITKQMNHFMEQTKDIAATRERQAKLELLAIQKQLKILEKERDEAEHRAYVAEEKVADYEQNLVKYRGQMEGEALRAITNGYRNALSAIPSSRTVTSPLDRLFPHRSDSCGENIEPPSDPSARLYSARSSYSRMPSRSGTMPSRNNLSRPILKK